MDFGQNSKLAAIGGYVFYGCTSLGSLTLPDSLRSIGNGAFDKCTSLLRISFGDGLTSMGPNAFPLHVFYDIDGHRGLPTAPDYLRGYLFIGSVFDQMVRQTGTEGNIDWCLVDDTLTLSRNPS